MAVAELRQEPMMAHLLDSLERGEDIGHYGRLVFVMVGRHFMDDDEILEHLSKDTDFSEEQGRLLLKQVEERGYNPPKRERILQWMEKQNFPICPEPDDPGQCNVYRNLDFPKEIYERISAFYEGKST
jgi:hypothetical protein